jgi:hypothetical protein
MAHTPPKAKGKKPKATDEIKVEPGFQKRLGEMYKKVLHTPPPRKQSEQPKSKKK